MCWYCLIFETLYISAQIPTFLKNITLNNLLNATKSSIQIILVFQDNIFHSTNSTAFRRFLNEIAEFNEETKGLIGGITLPVEYYSDPRNHPKEGLEIAEKLNIPLGVFLWICSDLDDVTNSVLLHLKKFKFITCGIEVYEQDYTNVEPEAVAEETMTIGYETKSRARVADIKADIFILIYYQAGSRRRFQRFWCHIVDEVVRKKQYPTFIILHSFLHSTDDGVSWWTVSLDSPDKQELIETFDYLPEGLENETCSNSCETCERMLDCCSGSCEVIYYMDGEFRVCVPINYTNECLTVFNNTERNVIANLDVNGIASTRTWIAISTVLLLVLLIFAISGVYIIRVSIILQLVSIYGFQPIVFLCRKKIPKFISPIKKW